MLRTLPTLAALALAGCTGLIGDGNGDGMTPEEAAARRMFTAKAAPVLATSCSGCHAGQRPVIDFLAGAAEMDVRATLLGFTPSVVNLEAPASSRLLTKGVHDGAALTSTEMADVLEWIRAEREAQPDPSDGGPVLETAAFAPAICTSGTAPSATCPINTIDLTDLGLPGAKIEFVAQALGSGLYLNKLQIIAGTDGAYLEHPLFVSWPEGSAPVADTIDRFFAVKMNLAANGTEMIAGGTAAFIGFVATDKITIHFKAVKGYQAEGGGGGGGGMGGGGCKVLDSFKTNARPLFAQAVGGAGQSCAGCHANAGNTNAVAALDIRTLNSTDDAMVKLACNQIRTRVNLTTPDQSGVFLAPDPANTNHPFRFTAAQLATFKNGPPGSGVLGWINAEKIAP